MWIIATIAGTSALGGLGFDLLVGWVMRSPAVDRIPDRGASGHTAWLTVEIKDPALTPSARKLTPSEAAHVRVCEARGLPHVVALSAADVLRAFGAEVG